MIDTHTHIYMPEFEAGGEEAYLRASESGVDVMIMPNVDLDTVCPLDSLYRRHPDRLRTAYGLHPTEVDADWRKTLWKIVPMLDSEGCMAVGEVGMDLYWDTTFRREQEDAFAEQLNIASEKRLPVIIHCRNALDEALQVISGLKTGCPRLLFHSFTGSAADAEKILSVVPDAFFGINGVVTFKNARELQDAVPAIGLERIVLETDSPYLAPVPHRGKRNESAFVVDVCDKVAVLFGISREEAEAATDSNARFIFNLRNHLKKSSRP